MSVIFVVYFSVLFLIGTSRSASLHPSLTESTEAYILTTTTDDFVESTVDDSNIGDIYPIDLDNPEFKQPDLILTDEQKKFLEAGVLAGIDLTKFPRRKWKDAIVPYTLDSSYSDREIAKIKNGMAMIESATCVRFREKLETDKDYVRVVDGNGCSSQLGRIGGGQKMSIAYNCPTGTVAHEFMHALGILHHQSRSDRDDYITVNWENIPDGWKSQFVKAKPLVYINYGTTYDYGSIMHYPAYLGPYYAMTAKEPGGESQMGQRVQLAQTDINLINAMYCLTP